MIRLSSGQESVATTNKKPRTTPRNTKMELYGTLKCRDNKRCQYMHSAEKGGSKWKYEQRRGDGECWDAVCGSVMMNVVVQKTREDKQYGGSG